MTKNAVLWSPIWSSSSSSYCIISRSSEMSNGANRAAQEIKIDFNVLPETNCQGLFNQKNQAGSLLILSCLITSFRTNTQFLLIQILTNQIS